MKVSKNTMSVITKVAHDIVSECNVSWGEAMKRSWAEYRRWLEKKERIYKYGSLKMKQDFAEKYGI